LFKDEIFVLTPKGDPISLPENATPVDFAYAVHTAIGNHCTMAKVNNKIVPLDSEIKSGDVIEIITSKKMNPSRNWLKFVKTGLAKGKIRQSLGIAPEKDERTAHFDTLLAQRIDASREKKFTLKLAKCCAPQYGDQITGIRLPSKRMMVHKFECEKIKDVNEKMKAKLEWTKREEIPKTSLQIEITDRIGLLSDILNIVSEEDINVETINTKVIKNKEFILLETNKTDKIKELTNKIKRVRNVVDVEVLVD